MTREASQYYRFRRAVFAVGAVLFGTLMASSVILWPTVHRWIAPTRLSCGCGLVSVQRPWWTVGLAAAVLAITAITIGGFVVGFIRHWRQARRQRATLLSAPHRRIRHLGLRLDYTLIETNSPTAVTVGLWRPEIIVARELVRRLTKRELLAVLSHERVHVANRDPLTIALMDSLVTGLWWLPGAREWLNAAHSLRELAADSQATDGYRQTTALSSAFLKLSDAFSSPLLSAFSPNRDRLEKLLDRNWEPPRRMWRWQTILAMSVVAIGALAIGRFTHATSPTLPSAVASACRQTIVMCESPHQATPSVTLLCTSNSCVTVERSWSSAYGQSKN